MSDLVIPEFPSDDEQPKQEPKVESVGGIKTDEGGRPVTDEGGRPLRIDNDDEQEA